MMVNKQPSRRLTKRSFFALFVHAVVFGFCYWFAVCVRSDFTLPERFQTVFWITLPAVLVIKLTVFYALGHCHVSWRYVAFSDLGLLLRAATLSTLVLAAVDYFMVTETRIPRTTLAVDWAMTIVALGGLRALWRMSREEVLPLFNRKDYRAALIVGANHSGESLARQLQVDPQLKYQIVGFLDQDASRHGSILAGIPVLGRPEDAARFGIAYDVEDVLVVSGHLSGKQLRQLMDRCQTANLNVKVLPGVDELLTGDYRLQVRDVQINDLLRREPVQLNSEAIGHLLEDRVVLVTGAGGSIGSEICRQVLRFNPRTLVLVEQAENALFLIEQELHRTIPQARLCPCIADITDERRVRAVLEEHRPHVIFHAAAHKHVPMMEHNPGEAVKNNILGTKLLAELANEYGVDRFVMISTDKAVNPTSVMGVSKQLAERFVHAFAEEAQTKYVVVRFGNVLGSNGSVVPIFQEQIRRGGPITVTHPEIERFFMTIPEASQLVLQSAAMGQGGEIFVLDMGEPVRIVDLAQDLIQLSGFSTDDIEIHFTGLRPGEKLYEELYFDDEQMLTTPHPKVFAAYHRPYALAEVRRGIVELTALAHAPAEAIKLKFKELVPEYRLGGEAKAGEAASKPTPHTSVATANGNGRHLSPKPDADQSDSDLPETSAAADSREAEEAAEPTTTSSVT
ncbi:MAG: polysaccharide biosynthesis protein [Pirellulales bacterium]|nr:polysaccharide biosynthesis protein [Pirellulales bacterium]